MLCNLCQTITTADLRDNDYDHQPSLLALKASAQSGCQLCNLLWMCLVKSCFPKAIAVHLTGRMFGHEHLIDTAIHLRGEFHDIWQQKPNWSAQSKIWVHSGQAVHDDGNQRTQVYGSLRVYATSGEVLLGLFTTLAVFIDQVFGL